MVKVLVNFAIGPVQSFIDKARKTSDLYAGSRLLSDLAEKAIQTLKSRQDLNNIKVEVIYPSEETKSKPNKLLLMAEVTGTNDVQAALDKINNILEELKKDLHQELSDIWRSLMQKLDIKVPAGYEKQLADYLEVYWAVLPLGDKSYHQGFNQANRLIGAVKNTRTFGQLSEEKPKPALGELGRKCTMCGEFNVLFYSSADTKTEEIDPRTGLKGRYISPAAENIYQKLKIKGMPISFAENEGLCSLCFLKRFYKYETTGSFASTAATALMDTLYKLNSSEEKKALLAKFKKLFGPYFDETLYYEENLTQEYFKKWGYPLSVLEEAQKLLKKIYKIKPKHVKFSKYYAVVALDGDDMGKWLSGEKLAEPGDLLGFHNSLTACLGDFSQKTNNLIKSPKGQIVYAGADDLLAFVNLSHLANVLSELRSSFPAIEEIKKIRSRSQHEKSSASMGVAVAHYKTPLSEVLAASRKMLKKAKSCPGKNYLALAVLKGSGEIVETAFSFIKDPEDNSYIILKSLKTIMGEINKGSFSKSFIKNLRKEFMPLLDKNGIYNEGHLLKAEIKRLLARSCMLAKNPEETKEVYKERKARTINDFHKQLAGLLDIFISDSTTRDFFNFLDMAVFIGKEVNHDQ